MAEDPGQRYASVDALDADIERCLNGAPVRAHGRAWGYVTGRFLARHRVGVISSAAAVLLLIGAAIAMAIMYVRAEHARAQAEQNFNDVRALSRYVLFDVYDRLESVPRAIFLRRDIAEKGSNTSIVCRAFPAHRPMFDSKWRKASSALDRAGGRELREPVRREGRGSEPRARPGDRPRAA